MNNRLRAQGEIFGIALLFVVLIVGVLIYGQVRALDPNIGEDLEKEGKHKILVESTINSIKKISTGCEVERNKDSLEDLMRYCLENSPHPDQDVYIDCGNGDEIPACHQSKVLLEETLEALFTDEEGGNPEDRREALLGEIPYTFNMIVPSFKQVSIHDQNLDNFEAIQEGLTQENYRSYGYKRVSAGNQIITTGVRAIEIDFNLYYR